MAKLTIELDVPDYIMKMAMSEESEKKLKEMCQLVCQKEFNGIERMFASTIPVSQSLLKNISQMLLQSVEDRLRGGKLTLDEDAPELLKHIYNTVKDGGSSLEAEFEEHRVELGEWMAGQKGSEMSTPFDFFEGLIKRD